MAGMAILRRWFAIAQPRAGRYLLFTVTLPAGDADYSGRWRAIKSVLVRGLRAEGVHHCAIWQVRFWEHAIRDETDLQRHVDYIYFNPVKQVTWCVRATGRIRRSIALIEQHALLRQYGVKHFCDFT